MSYSYLLKFFVIVNCENNQVSIEWQSLHWFILLMSASIHSFVDLLNRIFLPHVYIYNDEWYHDGHSLARSCVSAVWSNVTGINSVFYLHKASFLVVVNASAWETLRPQVFSLLWSQSHFFTKTSLFLRASVWMHRFIYTIWFRRVGVCVCAFRDSHPFSCAQNLRSVF